MYQKKKAVILFSGGLDSATILAIAAKKNFQNYLLTFDYGQKHNVELQFAQNFVNNYKEKFNIIEHQIAKIDLTIFNQSALVNSSISLHQNRSFEQIVSSDNAVPNSYVPARNSIFLSFAFGYAENILADAIFIGVNAIDYSGYPDCRPKFIKSFQRLINVSGVNLNSQKLKIFAPLIKMSKTQIIKKGTKLGVDYNLTWSCYSPQFKEGKYYSCKICDSCLLRSNGFENII